MDRGCHFGTFLSLITNIKWHRWGRGLSSFLFPPVQQVQLEAGTHPVTVGFSTVWPSLTTKVPRTSAQTACYRARNPFPRVFLSRVALVHPVQPFSSTCVVNCSPDFFHVQVHRYYILNTTKFSFYSIRLITPCSIFLDPLYLFTRASIDSC